MCCLDCISSLGVVPLDLSGVHLATATSGKGLRSYPGVSMVFYERDTAPGRFGESNSNSPDERALPRYLDLDYYAQRQGIPFTFSSNLLQALQASLKRGQWEKRFAALGELSPWLRESLRASGFLLVAPDGVAAPAIHTLALPETLDSVRIGNLLEEAGYRLSYNSEYLRRRNWIQICLMSECAKEKLVSLLNAMNRLCPKPQVALPSQ